MSCWLYHWLDGYCVIDCVIHLDYIGSKVKFMLGSLLGLLLGTGSLLGTRLGLVSRQLGSKHGLDSRLGTRLMLGTRLGAKFGNM